MIVPSVSWGTVSPTTRPRVRIPFTSRRPNSVLEAKSLFTCNGCVFIVIAQKSMLSDSVMVRPSPCSKCCPTSRSSKYLPLIGPPRVRSILARDLQFALVGHAAPSPVHPRVPGFEIPSSWLREPAKSDRLRPFRPLEHSPPGLIQAWALSNWVLDRLLWGPFSSRPIWLAGLSARRYSPSVSRRHSTHRRPHAHR